MSPARDLDSVRLHVVLLKHVISSGRSSLPPLVLTQMGTRLQQLVDVLMREGHYQTALQLPKYYLANLTAKPWHGLDDVPAQLRPTYQAAMEMIEAAHARLVEEYGTLGSLMESERECIHGAGAWTRFDITAAWLPRDDNQCTIATPAACALFAGLRQLGLPVIRAGYVAL